MTIKGQVTIPKRVRDALDLVPGSSQIEFDVTADGRVVLFKAGTRIPRSRSMKKQARANHPDRFERALGIATVKWRTEDLMELLRGE